MSNETLFDLPPVPPRKRKPFKRTQQYICKRCKWSASDSEGAYCSKHDLCIEFVNGLAVITKDNSLLECNKGVIL